MNKNLTRICFLISWLSYSSIASAKIESIIGPIPLEQNRNLISTIPDTENSEIIISRDQYLISYNKLTKNPNWVAWKVDNDSFGKVKRTNNFQADIDLDTYLRSNDNKYTVVQPTDYKGSCFDRGHQTPSADRTNSVEDNNATFFMSNMVPQTAYLNRVIWEHLESYTRLQVKQNNKVAYILAGPIYDEDFGKIGANKDIKVPSKEFKIIYFVDKDKPIESINAQTPSIAVIMPNTLTDGQKPLAIDGSCNKISQSSNPPEDSFAPTNNDDWKVFQTSVSEIENKAQIKINP